MNNRRSLFSRILSCLLIPLFFFVAFFHMLALPGSALEDPKTVGGGQMILCHNDSATVLYRKGSLHAPVPAGAATKLMAAIVFADAYEGRYDRSVVVDRRVVRTALSTMNPGLKNNETISVYDLLCGMLIADSQDAAYALAYDLFAGDPDSVELTVDRMNGAAADMELGGTRFAALCETAPADGDGDYSVSTLEDLLALALEAQKRPVIRRICALESRTVPATDRSPERLLLTRNYLLSARRVPGFTYKSATGLSSFEGGTLGSCGIFTAELDGRTYTCVVVGGAQRYDAFRDAKTLFEWGRANYSYKKVLDNAGIMGEVKVTLSGDSDYVTVAPARSLSAFVPNDVRPEEISVEVHQDIETMRAPVREGMVAGVVRVYYRGRMIGETDLVATGSLALSNRGYYASLFLDFISSPVFLAVCISVFMLILLYVLINARVRYLRQHRPRSFDYESIDADDSFEKIAEGAYVGLLSGGEEPQDGDETKQNASDGAPSSAADGEARPGKRLKKEKKPRAFAGAGGRNSAIKDRAPNEPSDAASRKEEEKREPEPSGQSRTGPASPEAAAKKSPARRDETKRAPEKNEKTRPAGKPVDASEPTGAREAFPHAVVPARADARTGEGEGADREGRAPEKQKRTARDSKPSYPKTELERRADLEERAAARRRARLEKEERKAREKEKEERKRAHTFFDAEKDGQTPVGLPEDEKDPGEYVPEGWGNENSDRDGLD